MLFDFAGNHFGKVFIRSLSSGFGDADELFQLARWKARAFGDGELNGRDHLQDAHLICSVCTLAKKKVCILLIFLQSPPMDLENIGPQEIKEWLAKVGKDREWLAKECHVSKPTVNGWLSAGRTIPRPAMSILKALMGKRIAINPSLPISTFMKAQDLATEKQTTLDGWIEGLIDDEIAKAEESGFCFTEAPEVPFLKVADERNESSPSIPAPGAKVKYPMGGRRRKG